MARNTRYRILGTLLALPVVTAGLTSCSDNSKAGQEHDAATAVISSLRARATGADGSDYAQTLAEYLPNQTVIVDGATPQPVTDGVIHGHVIDAVVAFAGTVASDESGE
ncbi:hypothetical protein [Nocardioides sp.]|uniref:hypothetical protein n=1 Tax=Nocardioides sp. TaxID=35761 RepID=UPI00262C01EA|nr:hypothetical protein [Nocardioides sp.]